MLVVKLQHWQIKILKGQNISTRLPGDSAITTLYTTEEKKTNILKACTCIWCYCHQHKTADPFFFAPAQKGTNVLRLNQIQIHCFALIFSTLCLHCTVNYLVFKHQLPCCANAVLKQMKFTCTDQMYWKRFCCFLNKQDWFTSWLTSYHRKEGNSLLDNISLPLNMFP